jgi:hypothetical protein
LSPVFSPPDEAGLDDEPVAALVAEDDDELDELELQAARATVAATGRASASHVARLLAISLYPFNLRG